MEAILEVCEAYGGGVKRQLDYLDEYVDKSKYRLIFLVSSKRSNNIPSSYLTDDRLSSAIKNPIALVSVLINIHRIIKMNSIRVVHAHSTIAGLILFVYKFLFPAASLRVVYTPHAYFTEVARTPITDKILLFVEKQMVRAFSKVVHVSDEEEQYALKNGIVDQPKSVVIKNGVGIPDISCVRHSYTTLINVARCTFQKNPELFLQVAESAVRENAKLKFIWVGDGPLLEKCRKVVKDKSLEKNIRFVGYSKRPCQYFAKSDIFLSTSRYEGLPFSVIEAMSFGLPLILTSVVGHKELVEGNGYLVTPDQMASNGILEQISAITASKRAMSDKSHDLVRERYSAKNMIVKIEDVYAQMVLKKGVITK